MKKSQNDTMTYTILQIRYAYFSFRYSVLLMFLLTCILRCYNYYSGPIDCPTFSTMTSRGIGGLQWLNAFVVNIPGVAAFFMDPFDAIAMMNLFIYLTVSIVIFVVVCAVGKYSWAGARTLRLPANRNTTGVLSPYLSF